MFFLPGWGSLWWNEWSTPCWIFHPWQWRGWGRPWTRSGVFLSYLRDRRRFLVFPWSSLLCLLAWLFLIHQLHLLWQSCGLGERGCLYAARFNPWHSLTSFCRYKILLFSACTMSARKSCILGSSITKKSIIWTVEELEERMVTFRHSFQLWQKQIPKIIQILDYP